MDRRPAWWNLLGLRRLRAQVRGFDLVYDLQTSDRSNQYFRLAGRPAWSGIAAGCSLPHDNLLRDYMHTLERQREQLEMAGIAAFPEPDLGWLSGAAPDLPHPYALLVPGAAPHRPRKRWPHFPGLALLLVARGLTPVVVGGRADAALGAAIVAACPRAIDLTGKTTIEELLPLAAHAALAIGNDTGPMHIAAAAGCPSVVLFSGDSDPTLTAPRMRDGGWPTLLREADLADLTVERVAEALPQRHTTRPA